MKKPTKIWRYLFKLQNFYNNKKPFYKIDSLRQSDINEAYFFAGVQDHSQFDISITYLYIELSKELNEENHYANLQRLLNLIALETIQVSNFKEVAIKQSDNFQKIYKIYKTNKYSSNKSFHPLAPEPNHIFRVQRLVMLLSKLPPKNFEKFDNSLNTFIWALEVRQNINPHLKFTLYMMLLLSSIEQLCDEPKYCKLHELCTECKREMFHHKKGEGQSNSLKSLIEGLLTGTGVDEGVKRVQRLYIKLRSPFLHSGKLYGEEKKGGFLSAVSRDKELLEDEVNILIMNKILLEQFCVKKVGLII